MKAEKEWKTAFWTRHNFYKYLVMLFELINAPTSRYNIFEWYIDILSDRRETWATHQKMLKYLLKQNLLVQSEKCNWHKKEIDFLKCMIEIDNIRINSNKLTSLKT